MRSRRSNGKPIITTMRLTNKYRENGGEWYLDYDDKKMLAYIQRDLAAARAEEPGRDWHLETRGTHVGWHRIADPARLFGKNPRRRYRRNSKRSLQVWDKHQLKIARDTLKMSDAGARVIGGMTKEEARRVIFKLTGRKAKENPRRRHGKKRRYRSRR